MSSPEAGGVSAQVAHLRTTPIKGFTMRDSSELTLTETGVVGDRAFFMVDDADKLMSATRTPRFLPYWARIDAELGVLTIGRDDDVLLSEEVTDGKPVRAHFFADRYATGHVVPGPWGELLSEVAGQPVRLVRAADPLGGYDVHRVSLASEASVRALDPGTGEPALDGRRFRMTIMIEGVPPYTEDTWTDRLVQVGESVVRVEAPIRRCAAVQKHPEGLVSRVDPLRRLQEVRGPMTSRNGRGLHLGVYGEVVVPGLVRVGDAVQADQPA